MRGRYVEPDSEPGEQKPEHPKVTPRFEIGSNLMATLIFLGLFVLIGFSVWSVTR